MCGFFLFVVVLGGFGFVLLGCFFLFFLVGVFGGLTPTVEH